MLAALSLVALSACGSEEPGTSADAPTSVGSGAPGTADTSATDAPTPSGELRAPEAIEMVGVESAGNPLTAAQKSFRDRWLGPR